MQKVLPAQLRMLRGFCTRKLAQFRASQLPPSLGEPFLDVELTPQNDDSAPMGEGHTPSEQSGGPVGDNMHMEEDTGSQSEAALLGSDNEGDSDLK